MLFPYKFVNHKMEIMQEYMDYIFYNVWMKAKYLGGFEPSLFDKNKNLQEIINYFNYADKSPQYGKDFVEKVKIIFEIFKELNSYQLKLLKKWYISNNNIKEICRGNKSPIRYAEIKFNDKLVNELYNLYSILYTQSKLGLKKILEHYKKFLNTNNKGYCPFCGLNRIKGKYHSKKEAYDHFLPQEHYPFININFHNLSPMCHECNSSYKLRKDPIYLNKKNRNKVFYPYNLFEYNINITLKINTSIKEKIVPNNIDLCTTYVSLNDKFDKTEETESWIKIFDIDERYKAVCSYDELGYYWLQKVLDESDNQPNKLSKEKIIEEIKRFYKSNPYAEYNFLQIPFFEASEKAGII